MKILKGLQMEGIDKKWDIPRLPRRRGQRTRIDKSVRSEFKQAWQKKGDSHVRNIFNIIIEVSLCKRSIGS